MNGNNVERIEYLTYKAQKEMITPEEQAELARLLGRNPQDFSGSDGLSILIGIALLALLAALLIGLLSTE